MMLLDFEVRGAVPLVRIPGARAIGAQAAVPKRRCRALGAMKVRWYAASKMKGWGNAGAEELPSSTMVTELRLFIEQRTCRSRVCGQHARSRLTSAVSNETAARQY